MKTRWKVFREKIKIVYFTDDTTISLADILTSARLIRKQLETLIFLIFYLSRTDSFRFYCNLNKSFCKEAFAEWMLFERLKWDASQRIIIILQLLLHRCFSQNLQKISEKIFLRATAHRDFRSCFNGRLMLKQLVDLSFKLIPSLPAVRKISPFEF